MPRLLTNNKAYAIIQSVMTKKSQPPRLRLIVNNVRPEPAEAPYRPANEQPEGRLRRLGGRMAAWAERTADRMSNLPGVLEDVVNLETALRRYDADKSLATEKKPFQGDAMRQGIAELDFTNGDRYSLSAVIFDEGNVFGIVTETLREGNLDVLTSAAIVQLPYGHNRRDESDIINTAPTLIDSVDFSELSESGQEWHEYLLAGRHDVVLGLDGTYSVRSIGQGGSVVADETTMRSLVKSGYNNAEMIVADLQADYTRWVPEPIVE